MVRHFLNLMKRCAGRSYNKKKNEEMSSRNNKSVRVTNFFNNDFFRTAKPVSPHDLS